MRREVYDLKADVADVDAAARAGDLNRLRALLTASRQEVRRAALAALLESGEPRVQHWAIERLLDRAEKVKNDAMRGLRDLESEALPTLEAHLERPDVGPLCAAIMASCRDGRDKLYQRDEHSLPLLLAAWRQTGLLVRVRLGVIKALVVIPDAAAGEALAEGLDHWSVLVGNAAGRALMAREDPRVVEWLLEAMRNGRTVGFSTIELLMDWILTAAGGQGVDAATRAPLVGWLLDRMERGYCVEVRTVEWLAELGAVEALPLLRRFCSWLSWVQYPPSVRRAAKAAIPRIEAAEQHVPSVALSRAAPPPGVPTPAALSLWAEEDTDEERAADAVDRADQAGGRA